MYSTNYLPISFLFLVLVVSAIFLSFSSTSKSAAQHHRGRRHLAAGAVITRMRVRCDVAHRYAITRVRTRMKNVGEGATETTFKIALPEMAFISNFSMIIEGIEYPGNVKEKSAAKAAYASAVRRGQSAGLVRAKPRHANRFSVSVNVARGAEVEFHLVYEELLRRKRGGYAINVLLRPEQVVDDLQVRVDIEESKPLRIVGNPHFQTGDVLSSSSNNDNRIDNEINDDDDNDDPSVSVTRPTSASASVTFRPTVGRQPSPSGLDGRLVVNYDVEREGGGGGGGGGNEVVLDDAGFFVHYFAPPGLKSVPKHVYFVLDRSGSMAGLKMRQLKDAMATILDELRVEDSFNILDFGSGYSVWDPERGSSSARYDYSSSRLWTKRLSRTHPIPASRVNVDRAKSYIRSMQIAGSTNIYDSLEKAINDLKSFVEGGSRKANLIMFLTDGEANVGQYSGTADIIHHLSRLNSDGTASIFSLGFGASLDYNLLKGLSLKNNGFARKIFEGADAKLQLTGFFAEISNLLLSDVRFSYVDQRIDASSITKGDFRHLFDGAEIVVAGKLAARSTTGSKSASAFNAVVRGTAAGGNPVTFNLAVEDTPSSTTSSSSPSSRLERLWAYLTIRQMLEKAAKSDSKVERKEAEAKALQMALKYNFVTKLTSMVVTKPPPPKKDEKKNEDEKDLLMDEDVESRIGGRPGVARGWGARSAGASASAGFAPPAYLKPWRPFSSFADSDPHFVVKLGVKSNSPLVCFDLQGNPGQKWSLLEAAVRSNDNKNKKKNNGNNIDKMNNNNNDDDKNNERSLKVVGELVGAPPTAKGLKRTYFGKININVAQETRQQRHRQLKKRQSQQQRRQLRIIVDADKIKIYSYNENSDNSNSSTNNNSDDDKPEVVYPWAEIPAKTENDTTANIAIGHGEDGRVDVTAAASASAATVVIWRGGGGGGGGGGWGEDALFVSIADSNVTLAVMRHHQWAKNGEKIRYVGFYLLDARGLLSSSAETSSSSSSTTTRGLIGRLVDENEARVSSSSSTTTRGLIGRLVDENEAGVSSSASASANEKRESSGLLHLKSGGRVRTIKVRRSERKNFFNGEILNCWFVSNSGRELFADGIEEYVVE